MNESFWAWLRDKVVPTLVVAAIGLAGTTALTVGRLDSAVADLRQTAKDNSDGINTELAKRQADCAAIQALLHALDIRLKEYETRQAAHESEAENWKSRISRNEQSVADLRSNAGARPEPFAGTEGRELDRRIRALERYVDLDNDRVLKLLDGKKQ